MSEAISVTVVPDGDDFLLTADNVEHRFTGYEGLNAFFSLASPPIDWNRGIATLNNAGKLCVHITRDGMRRWNKYLEGQRVRRT